MDFEDFENGHSALNLFSVAYIENRETFSQDMPYRVHRSPRKKLRITPMSASLVIDQLKNGFRRPGDFTPRIRTHRNWRPEFLMKYLRFNQRDYNKKCIMIVQHRERSFVPETPKICSIGLHSSSRNLNNSNDLSSLYDVTRNFKRRFDIVLRPTFKCKYWMEKSTPTSSTTLTSTDVSLKTQKNCQTVIINCTESANISKHDQIQKNNYNQSYEHTKEKSNMSDSLRGDYAAGDRSFISNDFNGSFRKEYKSCVTRDVQIQTSNRKSSRRKKMKKRSKLADNGIFHHKHRDNEPRGKIITDFRVDSHNSNKRKPRLCVQVLESKHADYINKFTAVNKQIEEITATLRETCYNDNSRNNLENFSEEYFSSVSDDAKINTNRESDESKFTIVRRRNKKTKIKNNLKEDDEREKIIRESESENMLEILYVDNTNDKFLDPSSREYSKDTITSSINPAIKLNDIFVHDSTRALSIDKTVHLLNRNSGNKKKEKRRFKQISFDLHLTKNDNKLQEFSIGAETFDKVHVRNNFIVPSDDKNIKDLFENFAGLEESRYHKKIVEEKVGEMAILEDIKKRIDRDFDDCSAERGENDTEDFLTASQKSSNFDRLFYEIIPMEDVASDRTLEKSKSMSLMVSGSPNLDLSEVQVRDSISTDAISEHSNKNSTLSEYFSCMQFPSMISFAENEDELALSFENHSLTAHDSHANSNCNYYDCSRSNLNLNNFTRSNLDGSFDCSYCNSECVAEYIPPNNFPIETRNAMIDTLELSEDRESFVEDTICKRLFGESKRKEEESHVEFEKRYTIDSTFETPKSSRYIGSIDSGVFSSSLIDLHPHENFIDKSGLKKKRRVENLKLDRSSLIVDFNSDNSCTDDNLDQRVNDVVRDLTEKLILCERRIKMKKMRKMGYKTRDRTRYYSRQTLSRTCKFSRSLCDAYYDLFNSPRWSSETEKIVSISTPTLLSLSDSEIENQDELRC